MSFVAAAIVGGAVIGGVASNAAADTQANALRHAGHTQQNTFNMINAQEQPYIQSGYGAQNALNYLLGTAGPQQMQTGENQPPLDLSSKLSPKQRLQLAISGGAGKKPQDGGVTPFSGNDFGATTGLGAGYLTHQFDTQDFYNNLDPGYQFQLQQGQNAVRNASTPGVGALSGPALKELMNYNQGLAGTSYQNAFNRYTQQQNNIFGRLSAIAGLGQNAATQVGTQGTALGQGIAQAQAAGGAAQAAGLVGIGNSLSSGIQLAGLLNSYGGSGGVGGLGANGQVLQQSTPAGGAGNASS